MKKKNKSLIKKGRVKNMALKVDRNEELVNNEVLSSIANAENKEVLSENPLENYVLTTKNGAELKPVVGEDTELVYNVTPEQMRDWQDPVKYKQGIRPLIGFYPETRTALIKKSAFIQKEAPINVARDEETARKLKIK